MTAPTTSGLTAAFVAEARRYYVPAIRWARANGWNTLLYRRLDRSVEVHKTDVCDRNTVRPMFKVVRKDSAVHQEFYPTSVAQAIDYLVVAGILPRAAASWRCGECNGYGYVSHMRYDGSEDTYECECMVVQP